jgi:hypothetical protein
MFQEIARLFTTPLRIKVVKFFALQPEVRATAVQVASSLASSKDSVLAELRALNRLGLLGTRAERTGRTFSWNGNYRAASAIQNFVIEATTPSDDVIAKIFRPLAPSLVVTAGALTNEERGTVDVLVVSRRPKDPRIAKAVKTLEATTAVPVRFAVMSVTEYLARREGYDRLLRDIFDFKHRVIIGRV